MGIGDDYSGPGGSLERKKSGRDKYNSDQFLQDRAFLETALRKLFSSEGYQAQLQAVADRTKEKIHLYLDELDPKERSLFEGNLLSSIELSESMLDNLVPPPSDGIDMHELRDRMDVQAEDRAAMDGTDHSPLELRRRFELELNPTGDMKVETLRGLRANTVGKLRRINGIITGAGDPKPKCTYAVYMCKECGNEIYDRLRTNAMTHYLNCPSQQCKTNRIQGTVFLTPRACRFTALREVTVQERPNEVPKGFIPRTMKVEVLGSCAYEGAPGMEVEMLGTMIPVTSDKYDSGIVANPVFRAVTLKSAKQSYTDILMEGNKLTKKAEDLNRNGNVYERLSRSVAPEVWGHEDVKKALLLQMVGSHIQETSEGLTHRGDIHVMLMGDPGIAKSQMLKWVHAATPRGIYTSGKGSSGVGLTAAVVRDPGTSESILEAGALVLSDNGVCCIDEFDKMDEDNRTSIHEGMEQQTITIAKGGINAKLSCRTPVLAACNPSGSSWDNSKSVVENVNIPTSLLSRFDLMWVMLDLPCTAEDGNTAAEAEKDRLLTEFVLDGWREGGERQSGRNDVLETDVIRAYIAKSKEFNPTVPKNLVAFIAEQYAELRKTRAEETSNYITPRTLLSIIRLALGHARLQWRSEITENDVNEATRLMKVCTDSAEQARTWMEWNKRTATRRTPATKVYDIFKSFKKTDPESKEVYALVADAMPRLEKEGLINLYLSALQEREDFNIWRLHKNAGGEVIKVIWT